MRLDLGTGTITTLYVRHDTQLRFVGVDAHGRPVLADLRYEVSPLVIVTGPGRDSTAGSGSWTNALVDGDLTWFAEVNGPALWVEDGSGIHTVGSPGTGATVRVAGPCR